MEQVKVKLKNNPYTVYMGANALERTGEILSGFKKGGRALIVSNKKVFSLYGKRLLNALKGFTPSVYLIKDGEQYKKLSAVEGILEACVKNKLDRHSTIIALGGGVVGDVAGFASAVYMRGIDIVQVPTTLLAQVDSSVGGKTGVDLPSGKNLAGAFHQPLFVIADVSVLSSLSEREFLNGMAEAIKHGIILDPNYLNFMEKNRDGILKRDKDLLLKIVKRSVQIKASVVEKDEKEKSGLRAFLNFGHTVGHAIESAMNYRGIKHGEAIAAGAVIAAGISKQAGLCSEETKNRINKVFSEYKLIKPLRNLKNSQIISRLSADKKAKNGKIIFVLTKEIGCVILKEITDFSVIKKELNRYKCTSF
ncbi:MAG TPA: 3-dehydroquinate synthase [Candidatus Goldiibacteriota bacterium]|nr:3-dehydroquinate synthase [Candidatus Goldiibacteriota bacterium]HPN64170.1 3-dehydroquinate synthase [Candidatus Goldiibacteriota bacterium]HRQ44405.1 3-dehydroquinate synthase [Candidatus Goldiibacteriota bacterium]